MQIKIETIDKIFNYLGRRPWAEVEGLIHEITDQVNAQEQKTPEADQKIKGKNSPDDSAKIKK